MDTCMHKTMASVASLEKIEIIRSQEFMASGGRLKFLKKMIILGPKTAILGLNFVEFWCWGLIFGGRGGPGPRAPPGSAPEDISALQFICTILSSRCNCRYSQNVFMYKYGIITDAMLNIYETHVNKLSRSFKQRDIMTSFLYPIIFIYIELHGVKG